MEQIEYEIVESSEFPLTSSKLPNGSLATIVEVVHNLPITKALRFKVDGSLIHISQALRNAACRKGYKISLAVRGNFIYVGRG